MSYKSYLAGVLIVLVSTCCAHGDEQRTRRIVLIAGKVHGDHPAGTHEYEKTVAALQKFLQESTVALDVEVTTVLNNWPDDEKLLDSADTILLVSNGGDRNEADHPLLAGDHWDVLRRQMQRGCGLVLLHWSTFIPDKHQDEILEWLGGYFDYQEGPGPQDWYSRIQHATGVVRPGDKQHPICRGITPFRLTDEYYYHIRFREGDDRVRPILTVPIPGETEEQVVAWAVERGDGGRGFGFTGCHFLNSFELPGFRRMLLNALVWTSGLDVPEGGVSLDHEQPIKAVVVTGDQHPAHLWRETTLALEDVLRADPRMQVESVPDPEFLAQPRLDDYDVLVMNYCNWEQPAGLSAAGKENFIRYLQQGGGLVIVHFSNGAFHFSLPNARESDWPQWRTQICRRVWDHTPEKSGHDAFGPFQVDIADENHPITSGLISFQTNDELYFRQQGDQPIHVLATARSRVTGADEPMAFVYRYDNSRVFQTVLGHAVESIRGDGTAELLRRGTAWAAGRRPTPANAAAQEPDKTALTEGRFGQALDARRGHVEVEHRDAYDAFPLAVECWVQVYDKNGFQIFVAKNPKSSAKHWEIYSYAGSGEFSAYLPGFRPAEIKSGVLIADGKWHHVAMTFDGRRLRLYVDGQLAKQEFLERIADGGEKSPLWIGAYPIDQIRCDGLIDDVRISKVVREIESAPEMALTADENTTGLWNFDDVQDGRAIDASPALNPAEFKLGSTASAAADSVLATEDHFEGFQETQVVDDRLQKMDTGRFFSTSLALAQGPTWKGIVVRVGEKREASVCYDTELLRVSAAWKEFLNFSPNRFGLIEMPSPASAPIFASDRNPGWARDGDFKDPRPKKPYGALPQDWAHYRGLYLHGDRVVLAYRVGQMQVLESPWMEEREGITAFTRTLELGPSEVQQQVLLCDRGTKPVGIDPNGALVRLAEGPNQQWIAVIPAHSEMVRVKFFFALTPANQDSLRAFAARSPIDDLHSWTQPGPPRWTNQIVTRGELGTDSSAAFVVDTLTVPYDNPYQALMFTSGHDFFLNGDAAIATVHGDVWRVSGIDENLSELRWKRMATGLFQPLGVKVIDERVFVTCRDQITILHDNNQDGEADFYENLNNEAHVSANGHEYVTNLEQDSEGWLYFLKGDSGGVTDHDGCLLRVSPQSKKLEVFATGIRNGNGLGIGPGDVITASPQEGNWTPSSSILEIRPDGFYGMMQVHHRSVKPANYDAPLCWIPRPMDNSSGGQTWIPPDCWGQFGGGLLHFSFGRCRMLLVMREVIDNQGQAAVTSFPVQFLSGAMRGRFHPRDRHLYVTGLRGWVTSAVRDGCFQRVRYTGNEIHMPAQISTHSNGVAIRFATPLNRESAEDVTNYTVDRWNYRWSEEYGSADYRPSDPRRRGHDAVVIRSATLQDDLQTVFLEIPDIQPVMQMSITYSLAAEDGTEMSSSIVQTIHRLGPAYEVVSRQSSGPIAGRLPDDVLERLEQGLVVRLENEKGQQDTFVSRMASLRTNDAANPSSFFSSGSYKATASGWLQLSARQRVAFRFNGQGVAQLYVNGLRILDSAGSDLSRYSSITIPLVAGHHHIQIRYESPLAGVGGYRLMWRGEDFAEEPVPPTSLTHDPNDAVLVAHQSRHEGQFLFAEYGCGNCHTVDNSTSPQDMSKQFFLLAAPHLKGIGSRLTADWMHHWLMSPAHLRTQATMPELLRLESATNDARDLTAFLLSLDESDAGVELLIDSVVDGDLDRGQKLFETLGCIGCHTFHPPSQADEFHRVSLHFAAAKFHVESLIAFLRQPARHYPKTKMPDFSLTRSEAADLVAFIRDRAKGQLAAVNMQGSDAVRGEQLFRELRCEQCHTEPIKPNDRSVVTMASWNQTSGCLAQDERSKGKAPRFRFTPKQRADLAEFLASPAGQETSQASTEHLISTLRCGACHSRDSHDAVLPIVLAEEGELGLIPEQIPALTWAGEKLQSTWVEQLLSGKLGYRSRPWMRARMPSFSGHATTIAHGLAAQHAVATGDVQEDTAITSESRQLAEALLDKSGLDCRQCHAPAHEVLDLKNEAQGIGLAYMSVRLRREYYDRWMRNPLRIDPATKMPQFSTDGVTTAAKHLAGGDAQQQFDAIWQYLRAIRQHEQ